MTSGEGRRYHRRQVVAARLSAAFPDQRRLGDRDSWHRRVGDRFDRVRNRSWSRCRQWWHRLHLCSGGLLGAASEREAEEQPHQQLHGAASIAASSSIRPQSGLSASGSRFASRTAFPEQRDASDEVFVQHLHVPPGFLKSLIHDVEPPIDGVEPPIAGVEPLVDGEAVAVRPGDDSLDRRSAGAWTTQLSANWTDQRQ